MERERDNSNLQHFFFSQQQQQNQMQLSKKQSLKDAQE